MSSSLTMDARSWMTSCLGLCTRTVAQYRLGWASILPTTYVENMNTQQEKFWCKNCCIFIFSPLLVWKRTSVLCICVPNYARMIEKPVWEWVEWGQGKRETDRKWKKNFLTAAIEGFLPSPAGGWVTSAPRKITGCWNTDGLEKER